MNEVETNVFRLRADRVPSSITPERYENIWGTFLDLLPRIIVALNGKTPEALSMLAENLCMNSMVAAGFSPEEVLRIGRVTECGPTEDVETLEEIAGLVSSWLDGGDPELTADAYAMLFIHGFDGEE